MKIILTGGTGFIGYPVLKKLVKLNYEILLLSRNTFFINNLKIRNIKLDLNNFLEKKEEIINFKPDVVLHLAWQGIPDYSERTSKLNYNNSFNFLNFVIENTNCKKIIVPGSCWEYNDGNILGECSEEIKIYPQKFFSIYKKKLFDELINKAEKKKIIFNWARLFYVYGPNQKKTSIIPTLIDSFLNNKVIKIESPNNKNDFIFIDDVVEILIFMLQSNLPSGVYNVGTGVTTEILELSYIIENKLKNSSYITDQIKEKINKPSLNFFANTGKLKKYFKSIKFENINSGLLKTIKYFQQNN
jgi:dTDP-6-deoxy-L-talose 4-dehydrogenase (NAD+)